MGRVLTLDHSAPTVSPMRRTGGLWLALVMLCLGVAACHPVYPACGNDKDCRTGEFCINGKCQQCKGDSDCNGGTCVQGRCDAKVQKNICSDDSQCPAGQSCIDGSCKACSSNDECGVGGKCNAGKCDRAAPTGQNGDGSNNGGCTFEPIYFDFNENVLSTEATTAIDHDADCLKKSPGAVTLTGHSDSRGTEEYNLALSDRRAQAVRDRLQRTGAPATSVRLVPKGELEASGTDESGWAKDRRVDFARQ
jgi:peptidoglycan-associated lipoprotein